MKLRHDDLLLRASSEIEDIYFFEGNTKYVSSTVMKISVNSRERRTSKLSDYLEHDMIFLVFTDQKQIFYLFPSI